MNRNLSGAYFRHKNNETGKFDSVCFEDLPIEARNEILATKTPEFVNSLCNLLADTLKQIGDQFGIEKE